MASGSRGQGPESCKVSRMVIVIAGAEGAQPRASFAVALGSLTAVCTGEGPKGTRVYSCDMLCMTAEMQLLRALARVCIMASSHTKAGRRGQQVSCEVQGLGTRV